MTALIPVLRVFHVFVTLAMIGVVLIQRSEGGGLGIGNTQGMGAFMSGRGTANLLTRTTSILAALFFGVSLTLALLQRGENTRVHDILGTAPAPLSVPAPGHEPLVLLPGQKGGASLAPVAPAKPAVPSVPK